MKAVDRFVCRREGHKPMFTITSAPKGMKIEYISPCQRCGKMVAATYTGGANAFAVEAS